MNVSLKMGEPSKPLISVIVPVYNTEKYLKQCLDSLQSQTLQNIEIVIIDDGSTDESSFICDKYMERDLRFRVIHKRNEGLSAARNDGLEESRADYIMSVDSDDWVEPEFCEKAYRIATEHNADIVVFQFDKYDSHGKHTSQRKFPLEGVVPKEEVLTKYWSYTTEVVWNKLYKRDLFEEIKYPEGYLCEDVAVTHRVIYQANNICFLDRMLYHHRINRPGSITCHKTAKTKADSTIFSFRRLLDLKRWGYNYEKEDEEVLALSYQARVGRQAEYSRQCDKILQECKSITQKTSWEQKVMFKVYKKSVILFDCISLLMGRRVRGTIYNRR